MTIGTVKFEVDAETFLEIYAALGYRLKDPNLTEGRRYKIQHTLDQLTPLAVSATQPKTLEKL